MATTFLLIRHGECELTGKVLYGRMPHVHLNGAGRAQVERLASYLAGTRIDAICSSPLERALETAEPLARRLGIEIETSEVLSEIDCGHWTGCEIPSLAGVGEWQRFNSYRSGTRAPGGELMLESQLRIIRELERLGREHTDRTVAVVSHGDVIRAAILYFLGSPLDFFLRLEITPASVSVVRLDEYGPVVLRVNDTGRTVFATGS